MHKTRSLYCLCLLIILIDPAGLLAQTHRFAVHLAGKEIGTVTASLTETNTTQTYQIHSDVTFKVLWKSYNRITSNRVTYKDEVVQTSYSGVYMNNDMEDSSRVSLFNRTYDCYRYPDEKFQLIDAPVQFSTAKLYFSEPVGIPRIYSELFLSFCPLEDQGNHRYKLYLPNGSVNYYTYADSKLIEVLVDRTWFNLRFSPL